MANGAQGPAMPGAELERLARQVWSAWEDALQRTMPGASASAMPGAPGPAAFGGFGAFAPPQGPWQSMVDWWQQQAAPQRGGFDDVAARFNGQAQQWWTQIQELANRFAGEAPAPEAVVRAWREALGGAAANPFAQMMSGVQGPGLEGWETWVQRLSPLFSGMEGQGRDWSSLPTVGLAREHQERWQTLARAFADYQGSQQAFQGLLQQASQGAFAHFERRLRERGTAAQPVDSPRALFDLWIDAAEDAYAEVAMSPPFRTAYAQMVDGQMRLRQAVQREIEQVCRMFDLPTRTELDGAHRKVAELERALRRMRDRMDAIEGGEAADPDRAARASTTPARTHSGPTRVVATPAPPSAETTATASPGPATGSRRGARRAKTASVPRKRPARTVVSTSGGTRAATTDSGKPGRKAAATAARASAAKKPARAGLGTKTGKRAARKTTTSAKPRGAPDTAGERVRPASKSARKTGAKRAAPERRTRVSKQAGAVPRGTAVAAATSRRDAVAGARVTQRPGRSRASSGRGTAPKQAAKKRAVRTAAPSPARVGRLPNLGFVSPIPKAPEPMKTGASGRRKR